MFKAVIEKHEKGNTIVSIWQTQEAKEYLCGYLNIPTKDHVAFMDIFAKGLSISQNFTTVEQGG